MTIKKIRGSAYEFPLRADFMAQIVVPLDLTVAEAQRLGLFLLTVSIDITAEQMALITQSAMHPPFSIETTKESL